MVASRKRKQLLQRCADSLGGNEPQRFVSECIDPELQKRLTDPDSINMVSILNDLDLFHKLDLFEDWIRGDRLVSQRIKEKGILAELDALKPKAIQKSVSPLPVKFTNRVKEFNKIDAISNPFQVWLIEAPAGYGKTELILEIQRRNEYLRKKNDYPGDDFLITLNRRTRFNVISLANKIVKIIGGKTKFKDGDGSNTIGTRMAAYILGLSIGTGENSGILTNFGKEILYSTVHGAEISILIDNVEILDDTTFRELSSLTSGFYLEFQKKQFFDRQNRIRIFLAGTNLLTRSSVFKDKSVSFFDLALSPFEFQYVDETVRNYSSLVSRPLHPDISATIAAHIMHLTGGHPGAMAEILQKLAREGFPGVPQCFQDNSDSYLGIVHKFTQKVVDNHLEVVSRFTDEISKYLPKSEDLFAILETLSVFRQYGTWLLENLIAQGLIQWKGRAYELKDLLYKNKTYFISKQESFLVNNISRALLATRLREGIPDGQARFATLCKFGRIQYSERILNPCGEPVAQLALEWLFQELQYDCYVEQLSGRSLINAIYEALDDVFVHLGIAHASPDVIEGFLNVLKKDWELIFLFNFFASEDGYKTEPSEEFIELVERKYCGFLGRQQ